MSDRDLDAQLRHRHQQKRATTTILVVLLMLFFAFWYAYSYYRASSDPDRASGSQATCRPYDPKVATPATTTINVYNASTKTGLAARTAAELKRRGFVIGVVSNDPLSRTITGPAEVRFGTRGQSQAKLVVPLGGKGTTQVADRRRGSQVDLVLGATFTTLAPAPSATGKPMCPAPSASVTSSG